MKKIKISKKDIKECCKNIICVGYCELQYLLQYKYADFYSCGVYGWSCDYYKIDDNLIISTGYSPIGNVKSNYKETRKAEQKAREIVLNRDLTIEQKKKKLDNLLNRYTRKVLEEK